MLGYSTIIRTGMAVNSSGQHTPLEVIADATVVEWRELLTDPLFGARHDDHAIDNAIAKPGDFIRAVARYRIERRSTSLERAQQHSDR
jgi:hypothetical protein